MMWRKIAIIGILGALAACNLSDDDPVVAVSNNTTTTNNNTTSGLCDPCGVCDDDTTNDCVQDCAGDFGGDATEDRCGTCDSDPANDCVQDCAGVYGGDSSEDNCGVCDADPANDCAVDCAGEFDGTAVLDMCGVCDSDPANECVQDCAGDFGGEAYIDLCGQCVGGSIGPVACSKAILPVIEDAYVMSNHPTANFGAADEVIVDQGTTETYLKFDLSTLPEGILIRGLKLKAVASESTDFGGTGDVGVYFSPDDSWSESWITYNRKPRFSEMSLASWNVTGSTTDVELEVLDAPGLIERVQSQLVGDKTVTFVLASQGFSSKYYSKESIDATKHMTLEVSYQVVSKVELPAVADAFVSADRTEYNYGSNTTLQVDPRAVSSTDPTYTTFIKFDLSAIPSNVTIERVSLQMLAFVGYAYGGDGNTYTYLVEDDTWDEASLTYSNRPAYQADSIGFWWLWYDLTYIDNWGINASLELVGPTIEAYNTDKLISFRLASSGYRTDYRSREWGDASQHPKLTVYFTEN